MDKVFFFAGGLTLLLFTLKIDLLLRPAPLRIVTVVCGALFVLGTMLHFTSIVRKYPSSGALICPLLHLGFFRVGRRLFVHRFNREPRSTYFDWSPGLAVDRVFNLAYFVVALLTWIFVPLLLGRLSRIGL
jgi:amino acid transporter